MLLIFGLGKKIIASLHFFNRKGKSWAHICLSLYISQLVQIWHGLQTPSIAARSQWMFTWGVHSFKHRLAPGLLPLSFSTYLAILSLVQFRGCGISGLTSFAIPWALHFWQDFRGSDSFRRTCFFFLLLSCIAFLPWAFCNFIRYV